MTADPDFSDRYDEVYAELDEVQDKLSKLSPNLEQNYQENLKGTSPKNAPTYQEEIIKKEEKSTKKWKCKICGYVFFNHKVNK